MSCGRIHVGSTRFFLGHGIVCLRRGDGLFSSSSSFFLFLLSLRFLLGFLLSLVLPFALRPFVSTADTPLGNRAREAGARIYGVDILESSLLGCFVRRQTVTVPGGTVTQS
ncbi:hypothetical protein SODALDRAFT_103258 [Sodiomyces alkalinus F11]|uniref:Uncharacterized protein n=1 Tax=Sodiomyces alkalinus (strain CBS 110278 / VKM F-3762 / F11) TaxID=1314773 RepID=A0A3N2Q1U3_SODAK|nr:hypothetical protein SODALDRAFT_103258 [Sodiomyces alkalinus F11]ROT40720.1 hypothetical protein SODALDRAFT_103258 [Sodiomyces alkalinus F11]